MPANTDPVQVLKSVMESLDNAYLKWKNILDQPLTLSAGRQDIALGDPDDWWLVMARHPRDGFVTFFLDSIRMDYVAKTDPDTST